MIKLWKAQIIAKGVILGRQPKIGIKVSVEQKSSQRCLPFLLVLLCKYMLTFAFFTFPIMPIS